MDQYLAIYLVIVSFLLFLYVLFDVNYFLGIGFALLWGRLVDKKVAFDEHTEIYGICTTQDLDIFLKHKNNARYLRELDFARYHFHDHVGLYAETSKVKAGYIVQSAASIRYRRTIPLLSTYKVTTKLVSWNEKNLFMEHQFITLKDGFIRAVAFTMQTAVGLNISEIMAKISGKDVSYRPKFPLEWEDWLESIEKSKTRYRNILK